MASYFITGASRGLGLDLVRELVNKPVSEVSIVYAGARTRTEGLEKLSSDARGRIEIVHLDVESEESVKTAASLVEHSRGPQGLDVLINVAGVMTHFPEGVTTMDDLNYVFNVNVTGVHILIKSLLPLLKKGNLKKIINYSSGLGSITRAPAWAQQDSPSYKVAKAALNMLTVQYALAMADEGFTIVVLSPGWVKTDLGGGDADLEIEASTKAVLDIVHGVGKDDNGKFLNIRAPEFDDRPEAFRYAGDEIPW
ncbi:putative short chain oxidoreductase [Ilyonectria robusta]|uniref:putative short chain oxidoreductase n=1 Tax=Ilyonectria robusta TaxID=1079257 RepID=UPI001E8DEB6F|nr:putative short chain oxidoreductase [Ilyonectria robusta]KAH8738469.1 putative short chain oxidoreductase [Ilyonectria robusta]